MLVQKTAISRQLTNSFREITSSQYCSHSVRLAHAISNNDNMKVLLTGGSGFIAAHCVDTLLRHGHNVVFTVRSDEKGDAILKNHPKASKEELSYCIVKDIAQENAFDDAVVSDPPFDAVLHTASPFHFNITDPKKDLLDPAIIGTTGILKSIHKSAPSVKRVIITSSFASILNPNKLSNITFGEKDWNPVTEEEATKDAATAYRASKTFAEKAAWEFVEKEKPGFSISTICPPLVVGPVVHYFNSLDSINTSNQRTLNMMRGNMKDGLAPSGVYIWVDVRDVADAHVLAMEKESAENKRFFVTAGYYSNAEIAGIVKDEFPEYKDKLPTELKVDRPDDVYKFDNSRSKEVLGLKYRPLKEAVVDLVKSLKEAGA
jgi:nucleoside-diphosphate-sugar epimerase